MTSLCHHLSAQETVNWVTTADGCVHTADADATKQFRRVGVGGVYWAYVYRIRHSLVQSYVEASRRNFTPAICCTLIRRQLERLDCVFVRVLIFVLLI